MTTGTILEQQVVAAYQARSLLPFPRSRFLFGFIIIPPPFPSHGSRSFPYRTVELYFNLLHYTAPSHRQEHPVGLHHALFQSCSLEYHQIWTEQAGLVSTGRISIRAFPPLSPGEQTSLQIPCNGAILPHPFNWSSWFAVASTLTSTNNSTSFALKIGNKCFMNRISFLSTPLKSSNTIIGLFRTSERSNPVGVVVVSSHNCLPIHPKDNRAQCKM